MAEAEEVEVTVVPAPEVVPASEMGVALEVSRIKESSGFMSLMRRASQFGQQIKQIKVKDEQTERFALESVAAIIRTHKQAEDVRKSITAWPRKFVEIINSNFKILTDDLAKQRATVEGEMRTYQTKKAIEARKQQAAMQKQVDKFNAQAEKKGYEKIGAEVPYIPPATTLRVEGATTYIKTSWKFEEVSKMDLIQAVAAGKEKPEALLVNKIYVENLIDAGIRNIPGLKIYDVKTPVTRTTPR